MNHKNSGYWRGLITGVMLGAGAAVLMTLRHEGETDDASEGDALSGTLDVAEDVADDVKAETHDVVDSV